MTTIKKIIEKYDLGVEVPEKFGELSKFDIDEVTDYHTENHDGNEVHVFTKPLFDEVVSEWILDLNNLSLSKIVKENGKRTYTGYESYEYFEENDDILMSVY